MKSFLAFTLSAMISFGPATAAKTDTFDTFTGASDHVTKGGVTITNNDDGTATVTFDQSFSLDGAPDLRVDFDKGGKIVSIADPEQLKNLNGAQSYVVPASLDIDAYNELYIWCLKFAVPLGVAQLN